MQVNSAELGLLQKIKPMIKSVYFNKFLSGSEKDLKKKKVYIGLDSFIQKQNELWSSYFVIHCV